MDEQTPKRKVSTGKCNFCGKEIAKSGISRHLAACNKRQAALEAETKDTKAKPAKIYHILVEGTYAPMYWLHVELSAEAKLSVLDQFLRDIWLECCGHLSKFEVSGQSYSSYPMEDFNDKSMNYALSKVLKPGTRVDYEYDFGSTTELTIKVVAERQGVAAAKKTGPVRILARNDPLEILCGKCHKNPAEYLCTECMWSTPEEAAFCKSCARKHECDPEMFLPVVNSPRMGVCAYTGDIPDKWAFWV